MEMQIPIETHPWPPYMPPEPRLIMLGTFPPKPLRWSMEFFYPNPQNDMWRIMGEIFYGNKDEFWLTQRKAFDPERIKSFLNEYGIALWDTAMRVKRLKDNASDKYLEIVERIDLPTLLDAYPTITSVVTTGEKATGVVASIVNCELPRIGNPVHCSLGGHDFDLWRMPSSSRAYPLSMVKKAETYRKMFVSSGILK